jgi:mannose/fructose/N-acetylgalactosamine-specific phosphotransferase system component IIB
VRAQCNKEAPYDARKQTERLTKGPTIDFLDDACTKKYRTFIFVKDSQQIQDATNTATETLDYLNTSKTHEKKDSQKVFKSKAACETDNACNVTGSLWNL